MSLILEDAGHALALCRTPQQCRQLPLQPQQPALDIAAVTLLAQRRLLLLLVKMIC